MKHAFRSYYANGVDIEVILFPVSSRPGAPAPTSNRTSALYRVLFWMIYRRGAFVGASSISASPLFFPPDASRATLSITGSVYPRCAAFVTYTCTHSYCFLIPPALISSVSLFLSLVSVSSLRVTALVTSSLHPLGCNRSTARSASFKEREEENEGEWERESSRTGKRQIRGGGRPRKAI